MKYLFQRIYTALVLWLKESEHFSFLFRVRIPPSNPKLSRITLLLQKEKEGRKKKRKEGRKNRKKKRKVKVKGTYLNLNLFLTGATIYDTLTFLFNNYMTPGEEVTHKFRVRYN